MTRQKISRAQVLRTFKFWRRRQEWIRYRLIPAGWPHIRRSPLPRELELEGIAFAGGISAGTLRRLDDGIFRLYGNNDAKLRAVVKRFYPIRSNIRGTPSRFFSGGDSQKVKLPGPPPKLAPAKRFVSSRRH